VIYKSLYLQLGHESGMCIAWRDTSKDHR